MPNPSRLTQIMTLAFSSLLIGSAFAPLLAQTSPAHRKITVDAASVLGIIKPFTQYNGAPEQPPPAPRPQQANAVPAQGRGNAALPATPEQAALYFRELGITSSRTHDSGGGDTMSNVVLNPNVIFPDKNADPNDPKSYNFGPTDLVVSSMIRDGVEPFFRVGDGHEGFVPDVDKFAEITRHVVLHYNKGWNNGFRYGIKYWEFWNEPDFVIPGRAQFWAGNAQQYYEFYAKVAKAIKQADAAARVGGPATASDDAQYQGPFLKYLRDHHVPIDFYTFHYYSIGGADPYDFNRMTDKIRKALIQYSFPRIPIMVTEYGYDLYALSTGAQRPAFFSAALGYMQDTSMDRAYYHRAGVGPLFSGSGLTPAGIVYQAHASLQATPERLKTTGSDTIGFDVLAGRATTASSDTSQEIRILITNYEIPQDHRGAYQIGQIVNNSAPYKGDLVLDFPQQQVQLHVLPRREPHYSNNGGYDLAVNNLPAWAAKGYSVTRYRLDNDHNMTELDASQHNERMLRLSADMPAPAVELVVIRSNTAGVATREGVWKVGPPQTVRER